MMLSTNACICYAFHLCICKFFYKTLLKYFNFGSVLKLGFLPFLHFMPKGPHFIKKTEKTSKQKMNETLERQFQICYKLWVEGGYFELCEENIISLKKFHWDPVRDLPIFPQAARHLIIHYQWEFSSTFLDLREAKKIFNYSRQLKILGTLIDLIDRYENNYISMKYPCGR